MMSLKKYEIQSSVLKLFSQFVWRWTSDEPVRRGKLLPVVNTDLIINASAPMFYHDADKEPAPAPFVHIRNVKLRSQLIEQAAVCDVWGISLRPYGSYCFAGDMNHCGERIIDLYARHPLLCGALIEDVRNASTESECAGFIEKYVEKLVNQVIADKDKDIMDRYLAAMISSGIGEYCKTAKIGVKRLERICKKYTGITPKQLQRIVRFQNAGNELIDREQAVSLADLAYTYQYADQTHFGRSFREYAEVTPSQFKNDSGIVKKWMLRKCVTQSY